MFYWLVKPLLMLAIIDIPSTKGLPYTPLIARAVIELTNIILISIVK